MPKRKISKKEEPLWEPIMNALKELIDSSLSLHDFAHAFCHLEITGHGRFSNELKKHFSKETLYIIRVEGFYPDITGFLVSQYGAELITAEVKPERIKIKNVFQAKNQAEIFDAKYTFLASPKPIPEEIRRFAIDRPSILNYSDNRRIAVAQFNEKTKHLQIYREFYRFLPWPFK